MGTVQWNSKWWSRKIRCITFSCNRIVWTKEAFSFWHVHSVCLPQTCFEVHTFPHQTMSSWLGRGQTVWRTSWFWMGRSSAPRSGRSPAPVCWRSSRTPALTRKSSPSIFSPRDLLRSVSVQSAQKCYWSCTRCFKVIVLHDASVFSSHDSWSATLFACHIRLLTWRPAGQEEEGADGKHFVRK